MRREMKERFRQLPAALQKQTLIRWALGAAALLVFVFILICTKEFAFGLPCMVLSLFMIVNGTQLLYNCTKGKYIVVKGVCSEVEKTAIRKRVKSFSMEVKERILTVSVHHRIKALSAGDEITVYLSESAPVYEKDGGDWIYSFYVLEINRKA